MRAITAGEREFLDEQIKIFRVCKQEAWETESTEQIEIDARRFAEIVAEQFYDLFADDERDFEIGKHDIEHRLWLDEAMMYFRNELLLSATARKVRDLAKKI